MSGEKNQSANSILYDRACKVMPGGVAHELRYKKPYPIYVHEAKGCYKWDADHRRYIDYKMGSASQMLGHCHPDVIAAVVNQARYTPFTSDCTAYEVEWAEMLCELYPCADQVRFTASGTEATMLAVRVGRAYSKRPKVLRIDGHYHGWHDHLLKGSKPGMKEAPSLGVPRDIQNLTVVAPANIELIADALSDPEIGTVILEASGANYGSIPLPDYFLQALRELTIKFGQVLVFDEIITGFRWSPGGRQARDNVVPDLTSLAKILTGGLPGGALVGKQALMRYLDPGETIDGMSPPISHKGTFNAAPFIAAGAIAALKHLRTGKPQARADAAAERLRSGLRKLFDQEDIDGAVYGESSTFHIYFGPCQNRSVEGLSPSVIRGTPKTLITALNRELAERGVNLMSHTSGVTSAAHDDEHIDNTLQVFEDVFKKIKQSGELAS
ncbi:aspartate aminotransferase family protein [Kiloniella sp.]|uniref:aspartate aminotransferase family protein n=1 Tax=Kiloniella sp. TaxID=1938587 RepID=UPI003B01FFA0